MRPDSFGNLQHLIRHCHFEIHSGLQRPPHYLDITVLDMAAVLAKMQRDAVRTGLFGYQCRMQRVRIGRAAHLAKRRDVVNIDTEIYVLHWFIVHGTSSVFLEISLQVQEDLAAF